MGRMPGELLRSTTKTYLDELSSKDDFRDEDGKINPFHKQVGDAFEESEFDLKDFQTVAELVRSSLTALWAEKKIFAYQTLSAALCLSVLYVFLFGLFTSFDPETVKETVNGPTFVFQLFSYDLIVFLVMTYFNAASITVVAIRLRGGNPTFRDGVEAATTKIWPLLIWSVILAFFGILLGLLRVELIGGALIAGTVAFFWSVATYFILPILLFEEEGMVSAMLRSTVFVRWIWRTALSKSSGATVVFIILGVLAAVAVLPVTIILGGSMVAIAILAAALSVLTIVASSLSCVLVASIYGLVRTGEIPDQASIYSLLRKAVQAIEPELNPLPAIGDERPSVKEGENLQRLPRH